MRRREQDRADVRDHSRRPLGTKCRKTDRRGTDPLARTIVMDLLITTSGFLLMVVAVLLAVRELSLN
jgi:hypothetical protein